MNAIVLAALLITAPADDFKTEPVCKVIVCNKLERSTLSPWSTIKDRMGETCFEAVLPKKEAKPGKILDSKSRWYQGSFNPTKKSVTRVQKVLKCSN